MSTNPTGHLPTDDAYAHCRDLPPSPADREVPMICSTDNPAGAAASPLAMSLPEQAYVREREHQRLEAFSERRVEIVKAIEEGRKPSLNRIRDDLSGPMMGASLGDALYGFY